MQLKTGSGREENREIMANPFASVPRGKGMRVAEWLIDLKAGIVLVKEPLHGKGPGYALDSAGVEVRLTHASELSEAVGSVAGAR